MLGMYRWGQSNITTLADLVRHKEMSIISYNTGYPPLFERTVSHVLEGPYSHVP